MTVIGNPGIGDPDVMSDKKVKPRRQRIIDDEGDADDGSRKRQKIDPGERDEYEEWRRERGGRDGDADQQHGQNRKAAEEAR